jgi:hypothetical protein
MKRGLSRRNPYPADCVYDGKALMLGELSKGGGYVASKPADAEGAAPTNPKYSGQNPVLERVADWSDLSMGLGLRRQEGPSQARYHYAEGVDCSIQGLILKGPKVTFVDIANWDPWPTGMYGLVEFNGWLFGLNGHHLHRRLSDVAWEHFADFGANVAYSATHFHSNVAGGTSILLLAMGTEPPRRITTGGSIQVCGDAIPAYQFLVVGRDLYRHHSTNLLSKCDSDADYWDVDNWGAENQFTIGDQAYNITSLAVTASGVLVITKPDGIYTLGPGGEHVQLFPYLRDITPTAGGEATTNWLNDIYTGYGQDIYKVGLDWTLETISPALLGVSTVGNPVLQSSIVGMVGYRTFGLYVAVYNSALNCTYILKYGAWRRADNGETGRMAVWHGSIVKAIAGKLQSMTISGVGADTDRHRLYFALDTQKVGWFQLPSTPNPINDPSYDFNTESGTKVYLPAWSGPTDAEDKVLRAASVSTLYADAATYAQVEYSLTYGGALVAVGTNYVTPPIQKAALPANTKAKVVEIALTLVNASATLTPQVDGLGLHYSLKSDLKQVFQIGILAEDGLVKRDGSQLRLSGQRIREFVEASVEKGVFTVILPDETTRSVHVLAGGITEGTAWDTRLNRWRASINVTLGELIEGSG